MKSIVKSPTPYKADTPARVPLACVASVSARVRRESWDESKKGNEGRGGGGRRKRLPENPTILKNCVCPRTRLLIGAVLVVLIK